MRKALYLTILLTLGIAILALTSCAGAGKDVVSRTGTVKFNELEGGFYGIVGDDGKNYDPINLREEFRKDGLSIRFQMKIREDITTTHMWGTPIEITKIELCET